MRRISSSPFGSSVRARLAGDYLGTLYTETAIQTGFSAAQEAASLLATDRQQGAVRGLPLATG